MRKRTASLLTALLLFLALPSLAAAQDRQPITVATMIDSEGAVLGKAIVQLLTENGVEVIDRTEFGTPDILRLALESGEVDLVVDYTGSGQYYHTVEDTSVFSDPVKGYETTRKLDLEANDIHWLTPSPANNTEGLAVRREFAEQEGLKTIQDLADYVNAGKDVKLITASYFAENLLGLAGFEEAYGFKLRADQLIVLASGNTAEMLKALYEQRDGVNVSLVYGTDGALKQMDLVVLEDPKSIPPVYLPAPVIRGEALRAWPQVEELLKPLFLSLDLTTLQGLNAQVAFEGRDPAEVAREYLTSIGLLPAK